MGSAHDFRGKYPGASDRVCEPCHTPHTGWQASSGPLWDHEVTQQEFTLYGDPAGTMNSTIDFLSILSKLCLSCHDGSLAVDAYGGQAGTTYVDDINPSAKIGTDLTDDHPIGMVYDPALAQADGELADPDTTVVTTATQSGTIKNVLLRGGKLTCETCHDVHNRDTLGGSRLLRRPLDGSDLCLVCHLK